MAKAIVIGKGPAGVSAAVYLLRAGIDTTIIAKGPGALARAEKVENYYGFAQPVAGADLLQAGMDQALRLGATYYEEEVVNLGFADTLTVTTNRQTLEADAVLLATGASRQMPNIPGVQELEGKGVSYCAVCDAFFYKGKDVAVLGCCDYALHEMAELLPVAKSVTMVTNGVPPVEHVPPGTQVITTPIAGLEGEEKLSGIHFADGTSLAAEGLFVAIGVAGSGDLARALGAETDGNRIVTGPDMATSVPGVYAAGDCTGGLLQVAKAVYEGAKAGTEMVKYLRAKDK